MIRLLLAGASMELLSLAGSLGYEVTGVADPAIKESSWCGLPVLQDDGAAIEAFRPEAVAIAIDDPRARNRAQDNFETLGLPIASLIGGYLGEATAHGNGLVIQRFAHLSEHCCVGRGVRLNVGANVMHDAILGDFVTVAPNAVLLGAVEVGSHSYVGANATVLPNVVVGSGCTIGAGAVVTREVADSATVKGSPAA